jgi:hypothetical protein
MTGKIYSSILNGKGITLNVKKETTGKCFGTENFKNIENSAFL